MKESEAWKGIRSYWESVESVVGWKLGDGATVKFWLDKWLSHHECLKSYVVRELEANIEEDNVQMYRLNTSEWD